MLLCFICFIERRRCKRTVYRSCIIKIILCLLASCLLLNHLWSRRSKSYLCLARRK